jgi:hypothetical protein
LVDNSAHIKLLPFINNVFPQILGCENLCQHQV